MQTCCGYRSCPSSCHRHLLLVMRTCLRLRLRPFRPPASAAVAAAAAAPSLPPLLCDADLLRAWRVSANAACGPCLVARRTRHASQETPNGSATSRAVLLLLARLSGSGTAKGSACRGSGSGCVRPGACGLGCGCGWGLGCAWSCRIARRTWCSAP
ncbi:hypothetical protein COO60DRAFT_1501783 [Scenedesmus sp. NREL 46B-D3]|nr:hypothetical protein COO60DRAFT_1501783 [Scenedesmus sp. NREL 46B-D3]